MTGTGEWLLGPIEAVERPFPFDPAVGRQHRSRRRRRRVVALLRQGRHREAVLQRREREIWVEFQENWISDLSLTPQLASSRSRSHQSIFILRIIICGEESSGIGRRWDLWWATGASWLQRRWPTSSSDRFPSGETAPSKSSRSGRTASKSSPPSATSTTWPTCNNGQSEIHGQSGVEMGKGEEERERERKRNSEGIYEVLK